MSDWFRKDFGDPTFADASLFRLREQFASLYRHATPSEDIAVFIRYETFEQLHCHVMLYFAPEVSELADYCGAEPCAMPTGDDLSLFIDSETAMETLYSGPVQYL